VAAKGVEVMKNYENKTEDSKPKEDGCKPSVLSDLLSAANQAVEALLCSKATIQAFHGEIAWNIYGKNSPEMKRINGAIDRLAKAIVLSGG
jgi:hypothetical protein